MSSYLIFLKIIQIDVWGIRTPFLFLEWIGMNAMLVFVMAAQGIFAAFVNGWYYKDPDNTIVRILPFDLYYYKGCILSFSRHIFSYDFFWIKCILRLSYSFKNSYFNPHVFLKYGEFRL